MTVVKKAKSYNLHFFMNKVCETKKIKPKSDLTPKKRETKHNGTN